MCHSCFRLFWDNRIGKYKPLTVHHVKELSKIIVDNKIKNLEQALKCEEIWNINNGKVLCRFCHDKEH